MKIKLLALSVLAVCVIALLLTNLIITVRMADEIEELRPAIQRRRSLPCESMPIKFALDNPDCANRLLEAMNVTNVKILPRGSLSDMNNYNITPLQEIRKRYNGT